MSATLRSLFGYFVTIVLTATGASMAIAQDATKLPEPLPLPGDAVDDCEVAAKAKYDAAIATADARYDQAVSDAEAE